MREPLREVCTASMILVDEIREYQVPYWNRLWCHMMTDNTADHGLQELHAMAGRLGLKREWFQDHPYHPHYDLPPHVREEAIRLGALPVSSRELLKRCRRANGRAASG